jgi:protein gp37
MGAKTSIQWTDATWAPARGCSRVSPGCENCYAEGVAARFSGAGLAFEGFAKFSGKRRLPQWTGKVALRPEHILDPLRWRAPRKVFVSSMTDIFHESLSNEDIAAIFGVMAIAKRHTFQVLTKRAKRMREWFAWVDTHAIKGGMIGPKRAFGLAFAAGLLVKLCGHDVPKSLMDSSVLDCPWPLPNVWLGVSAEDQARADERIPELLRTPAAVRGVSYEPALELVNLARWLPTSQRPGALERSMEALALPPRLDWVIVGGESGPRSRPFDVAWARSVIEQCRAAGVACFVKQMGRTVLGEDKGFAVDAWYFGDGKYWRPGIIGEHNHGRPTVARGFSADAIGFTLFDRSGGDMTEWPVDLRVRQFPVVRS